MTNELRTTRVSLRRLFVLEMLVLARMATPKKKKKFAVCLVLLGRVTKAWQVVANRVLWARDFSVALL